MHTTTYQIAKADSVVWLLAHSLIFNHYCSYNSETVATLTAAQADLMLFWAVSTFPFLEFNERIQLYHVRCIRTYLHSQTMHVRTYFSFFFLFCVI